MRSILFRLRNKCKICKQENIRYVKTPDLEGWWCPACKYWKSKDTKKASRSWDMRYIERAIRGHKLVTTGKKGVK